jgi:hypothetical protein
MAPRKPITGLSGSPTTGMSASFYDDKPDVTNQKRTASKMTEATNAPSQWAANKVAKIDRFADSQRKALAQDTERKARTKADRKKSPY